MEAKKQLAKTIITQWHGPQQAKQALEYFETTFQRKEISVQTPAVAIKAKNLTLLELLKLLPLNLSHAQLKRVISEGGVEINGHKQTDPQSTLTPKSGAIVKFGKHHFYKLVIEN